MKNMEEFNKEEFLEKLQENKYKDLVDPNRTFNVNKLINYFSYNIIAGYNYILSKVNKIFS